MRESDKEIRVMTTDENSCKSLAYFFSRTRELMEFEGCWDGMTEVIPCDEPLAGLKGFLVFSSVPHMQDADSSEVAMVFSWRFAEPIIRFVDIDFENHDPNSVIIKCIDEGWIRCDDPKNLRVGFINYEKSECMYFHVNVIKSLNEEANSKFLTTKPSASSAGD